MIRSQAIEISRVMSDLVTLFVDDLTVIDFSFLDMQHGLLGESWIVDIELTGQLDDCGMIFDFSHVKKLLKQHIDIAVDHQLLVAAAHPDVQVDESEDSYEITAQYGGEFGFYHCSPKQAVACILAEGVTQEAVATYLHQVLCKVLPDNVTELHVNLRNEQLESAYFQYSHGLKQHDGNCQRIAHGHRSKLYVYKDGQRNEALENAWCQAWQGIYLLKREDLLEAFEENGLPYYRTGYQANQGIFELVLPAGRCDITEETSTIEHIAEFIAEKIACQHPGHEIKVKVFEGVNKGAIATVLSPASS